MHFIRYLSEFIKKDLADGKLVMLGGPRQVGKTTLALALLGSDSPEHPAYLNWDLPSSRQMIMSGKLPNDQKLIVFDEIHKFHDWRNLLKGLWDQYHLRRTFIVTGSARLDYYRHGGDSLQGRYFHYRLHPFSYNEGTFARQAAATTEHLLKFSGFPEPYSRSDEVFLKRWRNERIRKVTQEDISDLEDVQEISKLQTLVALLPSRVGAPLSINNLANDVQLSFQTADRYIKILENLYYCYRITPFGLPLSRMIQKERKLYLWDWSEIDDTAARFENMVGSHLLKLAHFLEDTSGEPHQLHFLRNAQKLEIDFVLTKGKQAKPIFAVECKTGERNFSRSLQYFSSNSSIPIFYQVHLGDTNVEDAKLRAKIIPFAKLCEILAVP